jgi:hypothetical protein
MSSPHLKEGMLAQPFCSNNGVSSPHELGVSCSSSCRAGAATAALAGSPYLDIHECRSGSLSGRLCYCHGDRWGEVCPERERSIPHMISFELHLSRMDLWPGRFFVYLGSRRTPHNDIKAWVKRYAPPICALMADKLPDPAANALNQATFNNLSRMLLDSQIVSPSIFSSLVTFEINYSHHA